MPHKEPNLDVIFAPQNVHKFHNLSSVCLLKENVPHVCSKHLPRHSMYGIFTYICLTLTGKQVHIPYIECLGYTLH